MNVPFVSSKYEKPFKVKVMEAVFTATVLVVIVLCVYLYLDSTTNREYVIADSSSCMDTSYKNRFEKLVSNINEGMQTGIPSYDDAGVTYGDTIQITKGVGDFVNLTNEKGPVVKSFTSTNTFTKWSPTLTGQYMLNGHLYKNCTMYKPGGIVKLFDRYIFTAVGTYWADAFGLPEDRGATYRIHLDNGNYYDILVVDTKSFGDANAVNAPSGKSIGHSSSQGVCLTEFYRIDVNNSDRYPVRPQIGNRPGVDYESVLDVRNVEYSPSEDNTSLKMGNFNYSTTYKGEIVAVQRIIDPRVEQVLDEALAAYHEDLKTIVDGGNFIYK